MSVILPFPSRGGQVERRYTVEELLFERRSVAGVDRTGFDVEQFQSQLPEVLKDILRFGLRGRPLTRGDKSDSAMAMRILAHVIIDLEGLRARKQEKSLTSGRYLEKLCSPPVEARQ